MRPAAKTFHFEIVTPQDLAYQGTVVSLVAPQMEGFFGVLANHAPLLARSNGGKVTVREANGLPRSFEVGPGIVEVLNNRVVFLTKRAERVSA